MSNLLKYRQLLLKLNKLLKCNQKQASLFTNISVVNVNLHKTYDYALCAQSKLDIFRYKHSKKSQNQNISSSDEEKSGEEDAVDDKYAKIITVNVNSLRADLLLKSGLGIARNKIETLFYESKIRVNGRKMLKKSTMVNLGDEIDIVRGVSPTNQDFLTVSRIEVVSASEKGDGLSVKLRRNKSLIIEDYDAANALK